MRASLWKRLIVGLVLFGSVALIGVATGSFVGPRAMAGDSDGSASQYLDRARRRLRVVNAMIGHGMDRDSLCTCDDARSLDAVCLALRSLNADQVQLCKDVITKTADRVAFLARAANRVPLTVSEDPLFVEDPFGNKMEVSAGTDLGPKGAIITSYDRLLSMSPMDLISLLGHEFHHKAAYPQPLHYITDNDPIGAFNFPGGGRRLLDSVGAALAWYAYRHGLVGETMDTLDHFTCEISEASTGLDFQALGGSARIFSDNGKTYDTGVGNWPSDFGCSIGMDENGALDFRVKIHEETDCSPAGVTTRWTDLELWQTQDGATDDAPTKLKRLDHRRIHGWNPLCGPSPDHQMQISHREGGKTYQFAVQYIETINSN